MSHARSSRPSPPRSSHGRALELWQNVASEIDAIERAVISPSHDGFALLRGGSGTATLGFRRRGGPACSLADKSWA
jgi:hypothetical protein